MKGIACCGDCGYYSWKKHKCTRATDKGDAKSTFYADCPLPDVVAEQRPSVMLFSKIAEIYNADPHHVWPYNTPPYLYIQENKSIRNSSDSWAAWREIKYILEGELFGHTAQSYGKTWRLWTAKPTVEQMEATPWDA